MNKIMTRIFTTALLLMFGLGAWAGNQTIKVNITGSGTVQVNVESYSQSFTSTGNLAVTDAENKTVTLTITPGSGYVLSGSPIVVKTTEVMTRVDAGNVEVSGSGNNYTFTMPGDGYSGVSIDVTFANFTYYCLHNKDKGYMKQKNGGVENDGTFRYENSHDGNGFSIWVLSSDGYLQQEMYYLNVLNDQTLYLSPEKVTKWVMDTETVSGKNLLHPMGSSKYLCADNGPQLKESPTYYYNACEMTITEANGDSWKSGPSDVSWDNLQSPQLITYLRVYYTRNITATILKNDNNAENQVVASGKDSRCYQRLTYKSGGANKGNNWDITADGVAYNKTTSKQSNIKPTFTLESLDPIALSRHAAQDKEVTFALVTKPITPDASKNYLLYSIKAGDNDRYPYDDGITEGDPLKSDGKGGTGNASLLTDPADGGGNAQISWKVTVDDEGYYSFQNVNSRRYIYFDETVHASSDFGTVRVGATELPASDNRYRFRLYKTSNGDYGTCYQIIPYSKQWAVWKADGVVASAYAALNNNDYKGKSPKVISIFKPDGNSQWCIYKYEAEYRVRTDFTLSGPSMASATGDYEFTSADGWYGKYITESPKTGNGQRGLVCRGTYNTSNVQYIWTVVGLDDYINHDGWTAHNGGYGVTNTNNKKLTVTVSSLPVSAVLGTVQLQLRGGMQDKNSTTAPYKWTDTKTLAFTIQGDGTVVFTEIASLAEITNTSGAYRLTADVSDRPGVETFSGILDGGNHTISSLTVPLFTTLTNGTVRNLNIEDVGISSGDSEGNAGAIACVANGAARIYNCGVLSGSVSGSKYVGGLVGLLDGAARVINCFSYADITGGDIVGGIVGYNNIATTSQNLKTMVMNCMFYGDITAAGDKAPIYNGSNIANYYTSNSDRGLNNYNYFRFDKPYVSSINHYNCALGAEDRYLDRFEFFRHTLNSNRELAAWYITGNADDGKGDGNIMAKWVVDKSIAPYPILKPQGTYPSVVNHDAANAADIGDEAENHNQGRKFGELTVNISLGGAPSGAAINTGKSSITLNITDKNTANYDFNYRKVQLPYYNEVGTGNYTHNKVVTGWKITDFTGGTPGSFSTGVDAPAYNFVDRNCTNKDLYGTDGSNRVFSQGAYYEVPDGVTGISIEAYWADCTYLADAGLDVTYNTGYNTESQSAIAHYTNGSTYSINGDNQAVYTSFDNALTALGDTWTGNVYDKAIVLVGNYHKNFGASAPGGDVVKPLTVMSADLNFDNEPDYCLFYAHEQRRNVTPIRFDFITMPSIGLAMKASGSSKYVQAGIFRPKGWFEITNTALIRFSQFEYSYKASKTIASPLILMGGIYEQFVSTNQDGDAGNTTYLHLGGNAWFKEFNNGCHTNQPKKTPKVPISVSGGDFDKFYLSGVYRPNVTPDAENAECYIDGGRFGEVAGAGMQLINGNVTWLINGADIENFYGGGINEAKSITGNISTTISNSWVGNFYGGPKFGNMASGKEVTSIATDCHFDNFFGAGYGGNAYNRVGKKDESPNVTNVSADTWNGYITSEYNRAYDSGNGGIGASFDYEYLIHSNFSYKVARFYVNYASLSLATTRTTTSTLTRCTINKNFYGGGSLGSVNGDVTSTLTDCTVEGSAFGAGFSATTPTIDVMPKSNFVVPPSYDYNAGVFNDEHVEFPASVTYTWSDDATKFNLSSSYFKDDGDTHLIYTSTPLSDLGRVIGKVTLNIAGSTTVAGDVYGGGESSNVTGNTTVNILP